MKYVLDTDTLCALLKGHSVVVTRLDMAGKQAVSVPQPVWAEVAFGLENLPPSNGKKTLVERCRLIRGELAHAVWTERVSEHFGSIKAARCDISMGDHEVAMAAHALAAGAVLVTAAVDRMSRVPGLEVESWESES